MGQAIALRLADGFGVAINDLPSAKDNLESLSEELTSKGRRTYYIVAADVSVEAEVQSMVSTVVEKLGELNVVCSRFRNTQVAGTLKILILDMVVWRYTNDQTRSRRTHHQRGVLGHTSRLVRPQTRFRELRDLTRRGIGRSGFSAYSASKFAVRGLTQTAGMFCHINEHVKFDVRL